MSNIQSIIEKIQHLKKLSKDANNINEATAAACMAAKLIDKYRIEEEHLSQDFSSDPIEIAEDPVFIGKRLSTWKENLGAVIASHYGCQVYISSIRNGDKQLKIAGRRSDIELSRHMFNWLSCEVEVKAIIACIGKGKSISNAWKIGAVSGVDSQLKKMRSDLKKESQEMSCALVKIEDRLHKSKEFLHNNIHLKQSHKQATRLDGNAYNQGYSAGASIHLGSHLGGSSSANKLMK